MTFDTTTASPAPPEPPPRAGFPRWWQWAHVLSLEAPAVAALWLLGLANIHDLRLLPGTVEGLALCVWTIYVIDRTLDTVGKPAHQLDQRHGFYHRYRRVLLGLIIPAALALLGWMALTVIPAGLMWQSVALAMLVALYLAVYTAGELRAPRAFLAYGASLGALMLLNAMPVPGLFKAVVSLLMLVIMVLLFLRQVDLRLTVAVPKEVAGGMLFALGCTSAIRFYGSEDHLPAMLLETLLLAALFICNLSGITAREAEVAGPSASMRRFHPILLLATAALAVAAICLAQLGLVPERQWPLGVAVLAGAVLLGVLHFRRHGLSADGYRVLADLAVAVPALWLLR